MEISSYKFAKIGNTISFAEQFYYVHWRLTACITQQLNVTVSHSSGDEQYQFCQNNLHIQVYMTNKGYKLSAIR